MRYLTLEEIIYIYTEIIQRTGGQPGISDESVLESVLNKPLVAFEGEELYPDLFTKVAVFMYSLINSRPFVDGNKRTALICAMFLLRSNGYQVIAPKDSLVELVQGIENGQNKVDQLVTWLRKNTIPA
ncbi:MAG: type II toxin-antitoxin system death-on-curing family toxin [Negativicutes bacterium]|nr:type II toxin-antitoxin system death-on-curing family toxin [Negativicutes bacterium]